MTSLSFEKDADVKIHYNWLVNNIAYTVIDKKCSVVYLLYGDVITSSSADGNTAVVKRYTSGYSSASRFNTDVPNPEPVP